MDDEELTPSEKKTMETLPKERMPRAGLEDRVVSALRHRGVLRQRRNWIFEVTSLRLAGVIAASVVLLLGGFTLGFWANAWKAGQTDAKISLAVETTVAAALQRTGTAYLEALAELASLPDSTLSDEMLQAREVALSTLFNATGQVTKMVPKDYLAGQLLQVIATDGTMSNKEYEKKGERAVWF